MWALREEYFTLHGTSDSKNYDLFITWRSRHYGREVTTSQLFWIDTYLKTGRSLLLQLSMRLRTRCQRYVSSSETGRSWSHMLLSWLPRDADFDWWYSRYAARWKLISSNVVLHLIWTFSFPHSSPVLARPKAVTQDYKHVVRAWSQFTCCFPILHSVIQCEQSPCCYETNFLS